MDATSGYSTGVSLAEQFDSFVTQVREAGHSTSEYASNVGNSISQHVSDNKEAYIKGAAIAAASVATLSGILYLRNVGFTKNYGAKKSKIIEKALKQLPVSELKEIIALAEPMKLSRRQSRALAMTRNYLRCVENSLDVSGKFNAKRRQVIMRFALKLRETETVEVDTTAEEAARRELEEFGIGLDMSDEDIDAWFEDESPLPDPDYSSQQCQQTSSPVSQTSEPSSAPEAVETSEVSEVTVGNFTYNVPKRHRVFLNSQAQIKLYTSCVQSVLRKMGISESAYQVPENRMDTFRSHMRDIIPDRFWCK